MARILEEIPAARNSHNQKPPTPKKGGGQMLNLGEFGAASHDFVKIGPQAAKITPLFGHNSLSGDNRTRCSPLTLEKYKFERVHWFVAGNKRKGTSAIVDHL
ncbi:hypothetical protein E7811_16955 [Aliigemmobacter aestuarii]|uniref:Uncharacterized protein n=1 Tax=Aliigemmobacter aestuarii TaxID=1445661 RepID=A0A4S3MIS8_9RHOB|nr:hypothetical protein [Gemmobacter aestuarii]THD81160.1 hypothetical protein E7811_16955 [Gemmobacter aestuarii]